MNIAILSAAKVSLGEGALYAVIGFIIVLVVLALLVGIFYLSGFIFQSKLFNKPKSQKSAEQQAAATENDEDEQLVAVITAAISCMLEEENDGEEPEFVIKRIVRKK